MLTQNAFPLNSAAGKKKRSDISYLRLKIMQYWKTFLSLIVLINVMRSDTGLQSLLHLRVMKEIRERGSMFVCFLFYFISFIIFQSSRFNRSEHNSLEFFQNTTRKCQLRAQFHIPLTVCFSGLNRRGKTMWQL